MPRANPPGIRHARLAWCGLGLIALSGCAHAKTSVEGCRYDHRPPLPADVHKPAARIIAESRKVVVADASRRESDLARVLGGSSFRVSQMGTFGVDSASRDHYRPVALAGAFFVITVDRPHRVASVVSAFGDPWPGNSPRARYSRRFGYVEYKERLVSPELTEILVTVDLRRHRVVGITGGPNGEITSEVALPGQCPVPPRQED